MSELRKRFSLPREIPGWRSPSGPSPQSLGNSAEKGEEELWELEGGKTAGERCTESTKQGSGGFTETGSAITEPAWVCARSFAYILWLLAWCLGETPDSGN